MKKSTRAIAFLLVLMQLLLAACSNTDAQKGNEVSGETTAAGESDTGSGQVYTGLDELDLEGYEFRIMTKSTSAEHCHHTECFSVDEYVGEGVNDAVHDREIALLDRYNFVVEPFNIDDWSTQFQQSVQASDGNFDLGLQSTGPCSSVTLNGYTIPWNSLDNVDLTQPWWNQSAMDSLSVKDIVCYTTGDISYETIAFTYCMFFNKELCENWGISADSLYQAVEDGKWTISYLYSLTKDIYEDTDGDGNRTFEDLYGFTTNSLSGQAIYQISTDTLLTRKDANDMPYIIEDTEKLASLVEKMYILMYQNEGTFPVTKGYNTSDKGTQDWWAMTSYKLLHHTTLLTSGLFYELYHEYTEKDFDIGVLPLPKYDTAQKNYMTTADYHGTLAVIPTSANMQFTGFCATALAAYGRELITPAYYETALKSRYADTERDAEMIELTMQGLTYDMYSVYTTSSVLQSIIYDKSYDFSSYWAKSQKSINKSFDKIIDTFEGYIGE